ncbi:hypothetical protein [Lentzea guizhouensis]|uniref:hypothetical protein n=1 Tax=Lentzea guizhouensis TaxID=1586287 RepID=UPI0012B6901D|nr:hypothetical protein [Lentzea guizhouensis]
MHESRQTVNTVDRRGRVHAELDRVVELAHQRKPASMIGPDQCDATFRAVVA